MNAYLHLLTPALSAVGAAIALIYLWRSRQAAKAAAAEEGILEAAELYDRSKSAKRRAIAAFLIPALVAPALAIVPPGHRGALYSVAGGVSPSERVEGVSLVLPWLQHVALVDVRTRKFFTDQAYAQTRDLQEVTVVASVNYRIDPDRAAELYQDIGSAYEQTVIAPAVFQRVKEEVGLVRALDFAASRASIAEGIRDKLTVQLAGYGIVVEYVNVEDAVFDSAFITAVKEKVIADEEVEEQRRLVEAEEHKKQQAIRQAEARAETIRLEAEAQAEANRRVAASLTPELLEWQLLVRWNGQLPTTLLGASDGVSILLNGSEIR